MLKAIIVDDEKHCVDRLLLLLKKHSATFRTIKICNTIDSAKTEIEKESPDVIFLDIQLHDTTGFDLLAQVDLIDFEVIFTTAYDNFAIRAFRFSALDYLLKPIDEEELDSAVVKLKDRQGLKSMSQKVETLFYNFKRNLSHEKRLAIPSLEGLTMVDVDQIMHLQSDVNYTHIFITSGKKLTAPKTLKYFEDLLDSDHFFRVHKSHLVNVSFISTYLKGKGGHIVLSDGSKIEVAVRRKELLLNKLNAS